MKWLLQFLAMLGVNAVPALGWFVEGWSAGTTLAIYWFGNVAACLFIAARIALHRRWAPLRGHFEYRARDGAKRRPGGSFLGGYLTISLVFSAAHGLFLAALILVLSHNEKGGLFDVNWRNLDLGCRNVLLFLAVDFGADLPGLRKWTFLRMEQMADRNLARVVIVHITIVFGMFGLALTGAAKAFFGIFVGLKTLNDLAGVLPQWEPARAPAWLCNVMDRVPNTRPGEKFADFWLKGREEETARREANEKPWPGR